MTTENLTYLVAIDGSLPSLRAVEQAARIAAQREPKGRLEIVTVLDLSRIDVSGGLLVSADQLIHLKDKVMDHQLVHAVAKAKEIAPQVEVVMELLEGKTVPAILAKVKGHVAAVFVGRSGKHDAARLLMGSIPPRLIDKSSVPVVIVP